MSVMLRRMVLGWLADGTLSLTAVRMLRPILTSANYLGVLTEARRRSKTEVEHHVQPFGHQGPATVDNISLRCRAHNVYESEQVFGRFDRADLNFYVASREYTPFRNGG